MKFDCDSGEGEYHAHILYTKKKIFDFDIEFKKKTTRNRC